MGEGEVKMKRRGDEERNLGRAGGGELLTKGGLVIRH